MTETCRYCPHACVLSEGEEGFCRARANADGHIVSRSYGRITSLSLDPIEKKPLRRFHPGSLILSLGSFGCNMRCPFCQNASISQVSEMQAGTAEIAPDELVRKAEELKSRGNIGLAYTYNEPLTMWEFVRDCAVRIHRKGMQNVMVSNGQATDAVLDEILPVTDAWNIDLKTFDPHRYRKWGGDLETVKNTIRRASGTGHVEVTTLIVPGENDTPEEIDRISSWLAETDPDIPLHLSRFFPRFRMTDRDATDIGLIYMLAERARKNLHFVYTGNC
jgi:pyruvate formate lyase activating enzyme